MLYNKIISIILIFQGGSQTTLNLLIFEMESIVINNNLLL